MRVLRGLLIASVVLLVTGFQAAPGPYVLCAQICPMGEDGELVGVVCWSGPEQSGCCLSSTEQIEEQPCCMDESSCPAVAECPSNEDCGEGTCPVGPRDCFFCLPGRILAEKSPELPRAPLDGGATFVASATSHLSHSYNLIQKKGLTKKGVVVFYYGAGALLGICGILVEVGRSSILPVFIVLLAAGVLGFLTVKLRLLAED